MNAAGRLASFACIVSMSLAACSTLQSRADVSPVDQQFMLNAAAVGVAEVRMAELALEKSRDPGVRDFAQHMLNDHRRVNDELMQVARAKGVVLPMMMDPANRTLYEELAALPEARFDQQYMVAQLNIHNMGNGLYASEARNGEDPAVKAFAARNAPVGVQHVAMARSLAAQVQ
jgi:putative membrane protein